MVIFPNCKINLGLNITGRRSDGYHDLETVFYPVKLCDALEVIEAQAATGVPFSLSGLPVGDAPEDNLCIRAFRMISTDFPKLPSVRIHLHKNIPLGGGLGGGSADGAFMIRLLNQKFQLGLSIEKQMDYALQLGSDGPFFIRNTPCFARGRGEILEPLSVDLSAYKLVLVHPNIHVSTKNAFSWITPARPVKPIPEILVGPVSEWKQDLHNDFEQAVASRYPVVKQIKDTLYSKGAVYASMTGSGSSVYGLFEKQEDVVAAFPQEFLVKMISLAS